MAEDSPEVAQNIDDAEEEGSNRGKMLLFGGVLLIAVGASIAGTVFFLNNGEAEPTDAEVVEEVVEEGAPALYHNLRPAFVINLMANDKPRYLQTEITVLSRSPDSVEAIVTHAPLIRNKLINFLSDQDYLELQTDEGKQALRLAAVDLLNDVLRKETGRTGVESVLLTSFVLQ